MNFFVYKSVAERYARYRPYFHPLVIKKVKNYLNLRGPVPVALDVGCGSGQSSVALKGIADLVLGVDVSAEMLGVAEKQPGMYYIQSAAEELAVRSESCDLLTTSLAYHWFDEKEFFAEAGRVLKKGSWLIISNNGFKGQMDGEPAFEKWDWQVYEKRYPTPPRNMAPVTSAFAREHGFRFAYREEYENQMHFTVEELAAYLITQSNIIAATEQGDEKVEDVYRWLIEQTQPFFRAEKAAFAFSGFIWYLQRVS